MFERDRYRISHSIKAFSVIEQRNRTREHDDRQASKHSRCKARCCVQAYDLERHPTVNVSV